MISGRGEVSPMKYTVAGGFVLLMLLCGTMVTAEEITIHFIDVGDGDAVLLQGGEKNVLIDAGSDRTSTANYLSKQNITDVDLFLVTSPHGGQSSGIIEVMNRTVIHEFRDFGNDTRRMPYDRVRSRLQNESIPWSALVPGEIIDIPDLVSITVLTDAQIERPEEGGMILEIKTGNITALLLSGTRVPTTHSEEIQIVRPGVTSSGKGTSTMFLRTLSPKTAIVSSGRSGNGPPKPMIHGLEAMGAEVYRTDTWGSVIIYTDGERYNIGTARKGPAGSISLVSVIETRPPG